MHQVRRYPGLNKSIRLLYRTLITAVLLSGAVVAAPFMPKTQYDSVLCGAIYAVIVVLAVIAGAQWIGSVSKRATHLSIADRDMGDAVAANTVLSNLGKDAVPPDVLGKFKWSITESNRAVSRYHELSNWQYDYWVASIWGLVVTGLLAALTLLVCILFWTSISVWIRGAMVLGAVLTTVWAILFGISVYLACKDPPVPLLKTEDDVGNAVFDAIQRLADPAMGMKMMIFTLADQGVDGILGYLQQLLGNNLKAMQAPGQATPTLGELVQKLAQMLMCSGDQSFYTCSSNMPAAVACTTAAVPAAVTCTTAAVPQTVCSYMPPQPVPCMPQPVHCGCQSSRPACH